MISLNAASPGSIPFACMTVAAISADVSGPQGLLRKPGQLIVSEIPGPAIGPLWRDGIGICARGNNLIVASKFARFARWRAIRFSRS